MRTPPPPSRSGCPGFTVPNVSNVAAAARYSRQHLATEFFKVTGRALRTVLKERRLRRAARALRAGATISEAVEASRYVSEAYFRTEFRARFGMTPSAYRRAAKRAHLAARFGG